MSDITDKQHRAARLAPGFSRNFIIVLAVLLLVVALVTLGGVARLRQQRTQARMLNLLPDVAAADPGLVRSARAQAEPLYAQHCAACHGGEMQGNLALGAPSLRDAVWLYGGSAFAIERTLLYGVRSGLDKAHDVVDMPAFGTTGKLSEAEIRAVVQYVLQISGQPYQAVAASDGKAVFNGKAACYDCHGSDARGNTDYGAPDLTANVWNSGGDAASLYRTLYFGQHRRMTGWRGTLTLAQIRALAIYVHSVATPATAGPAARYPEVGE